MRFLVCRRLVTLNTTKTKVVTTYIFQNSKVIHIDDVFLEILVGDDVHKSLGKFLTGNFRSLGHMEIADAKFM